MNNGRIKRLHLYEKDKTCFVCGEEVRTFEEASLEHIIPRSLGGNHSLKNLSISHISCNRIRGNSMDRDEWMRRVRPNDEKIKSLRRVASLQESDQFMKVLAKKFSRWLRFVGKSS